MDRLQSYDLQIKYDLNTVLELIDCRSDNPNFLTYKDQLKALIERVDGVMKPKGYVVLDSDNEKTKVQCLVSIGKEVEIMTSQLFADYEYLEGMMLNALADTVLFEATNHLFEIINKVVKDEGQYLSSRFEPGNSDVPMSIQKTLFDQIVPEFDLDMIITEGFMLSPAKSLVYYYEVTEEDCTFGVDHDCSLCESNCPHRKYIINIYKDDTHEIIQGKKGENLLEVLRRNDVYVNAPCNGMHTCGKCKVTAKDHGYEHSESEKKHLTDIDDAKDTILACYHEIDRDLNIYINSDASHQEIETGYEAFEVKAAKYEAKDYVKENYPIGIGVDIGTTTLAVSLVNLITQEVIDVKKKINPQKAYGADVISRIMYVGEHKDQKLCNLIRDVILAMTTELINESSYDWKHIEEMVISGNTTMIYLLLDMDPEALAVAPFTTVDMGMKICDSTELFGDVDAFKVTILPWMSAYVGGDIVSGLFATHMLDKTENIVFVDIGTNGEMVLKTKDRMICAATAAGPAFEGANITCGMGALSGAICEIKADGDGYDVKTLGDDEPVGICGSALIDAVALMLKQGHVDAMGFMAEPVMLFGDIGIYPADIRQVQLAKAAIYAGVEVLLDVAGLTLDDVDAFYIAGGFGSHLDIENSARIGLIPAEIVDKAKVVGNSSLAGSVRYLLEKEGTKEIEAITEHCEYEELSMNMKFNMMYVEAMLFE